jgi:hypothetical protein
MITLSRKKLPFVSEQERIYGNSTIDVHWVLYVCNKGEEQETQAEKGLRKWSNIFEVYSISTKKENEI